MRLLSARPPAPAAATSPAPRAGRNRARGTLLPRLARWSLPAVLAMAALCAGCRDGGGSDTETLTGLLLGPDGSPAAGVPVRLVPEGYDPSRPAPARIRSALTDAEGRFALPKVSGGTYNLLATGAPGAFGYSGGVGVFVPGLPGDSLPGTLSLAKARVFFISLHDDAYTPADSGRAWFPGTDILVRCEGVTATEVESLPAGLEDVMLESLAGWRHAYRVTLPGDSLVINANRQGVSVSEY